MEKSPNLVPRAFALETFPEQHLTSYILIKIFRRLKQITPVYCYGIRCHGNKLALSKVMRSLSLRWNSHILGNIYCLCHVTERGVSLKEGKKKTRVRDVYFYFSNFLSLYTVLLASKLFSLVVQRATRVKSSVTTGGNLN